MDLAWKFDIHFPSPLFRGSTRPGYVAVATWAREGDVAVHLSKDPGRPACYVMPQLAQDVASGHFPFNAFSNAQCPDDHL